MLHFYVDIPAPSLHGNNSEIGAKTVNIKMSYRFIYLCMSHKLLQWFMLSLPDENDSSGMSIQITIQAVHR